TTVGTDPVWVAVDPLDRFVYVSNSGLSTPSVVEGTISGWILGPGGALSAIAGSPFTSGFTATTNTGAIAIDPTGRFLYVTDGVNNEVVGYMIDQSTGATAGALAPMLALGGTAGSPYATGAGPYAVTVDPSGHFVYVGNSYVPSISMFTADPNTGLLTPVAGSPLSYTGAGADAIAIE